MAVLENIQSGQQALGTSSDFDITLPSAVDTSRAAIFTSVRGTNNTPLNTQVAPLFINGGAGIRLTRAGTGSGMTVAYNVVQWELAADVQHFAVTEPHDGTIVPIPIEVDIDRTFVLSNFRTIGNSWGADDFVLVTLEDDGVGGQQLRFNNSNPGGQVSDNSIMYCQVIEYQGCDVQHIPFSIVSGDVAIIQLHNFADLGRTFPLMTWRCVPSFRDNVDQYMLSALQDSVTSTIIRRRAGGTTIDAGMLQLVTLNDTSRVARQLVQQDGVTTQSVVSNGVVNADVMRSIVVGGGYGGWGGVTAYNGDDNIGPAWYTFRYTNNGQTIEVERDSTLGAIGESDNYAIELFAGQPIFERSCNVLGRGFVVASTDSSVAVNVGSGTTDATYTIDRNYRCEVLGTGQTDANYIGETANFYIAPGGNDGGTGEVGDPFATLSHAMSVAQPGDVIQMRGGTYVANLNGSTTSGGFGDFTNVATQAQPITIKNFPGEIPLLDGDNEYICINLLNAEWIIIDGLEFTNYRRQAIRMEGASNCEGIRCIAHPRNTHNHSSGQMRGIDCYRCGFVDCLSYGDGIIGSKGFIGFEFKGAFDGSTTNNPLPPPGVPEEDWDTWDGYPGSSIECYFKNCMAWDHLRDLGDGDGFLFKFGVRCLAEDCVSFYNGDDGFCAQGGWKCTWRRCIAYDMRTGGNNNAFKTANKDSNLSTFERCIAVDCQDDGFDAQNDSKAKFINCLAVNTKNGYVIVDFDSSDPSTGAIDIVNCIGWNNTNRDFWFNTAMPAQNVATFSNNFIGDGVEEPYGGTNNILGGNPGLVQYPLTVNKNVPTTGSIPSRIDFIRDQILAQLAIQDTSVCKDAGIVFPPYTVDFNGTAPDIGSQEIPEEGGPTTFNRLVDVQGSGFTQAERISTAINIGSGTIEAYGEVVLPGVESRSCNVIGGGVITATASATSLVSVTGGGTTDATYAVVRPRQATISGGGTIQATTDENVVVSVVGSGIITANLGPFSRFRSVSVLGSGDCSTVLGTINVEIRQARVNGSGIIGADRLGSEFNRDIDNTGGGTATATRSWNRTVEVTGSGFTFVTATGGTPVPEAGPMGSCQLNECALGTVNGLKAFLSIDDSTLLDTAMEIWHDGSLGTQGASIQVFDDFLRLSRTSGAGDLVQDYVWSQFPKLEDIRDAIQGSGLGWTCVLYGIADASSSTMIQEGEKSAYTFTGRADTKYVNECQLVLALNAATEKIHRECGRVLCAQNHVEELPPDPTLVLNNWPLINVYQVAIGRKEILHVTNTDPTAAQAFVETYDGERMILTLAGGFNSVGVEIDFAEQGITSVGELMVFINTLSAIGWSAELVGDGEMPVDRIVTEGGKPALNEIAKIYRFGDPVGLYETDTAKGLIREKGGWRGAQVYGPQYQGVLSGTAQFTTWRNTTERIWVSYRGGWETIPADIELLCYELILENISDRSKPYGLKREQLGDYMWERITDEDTDGRYGITMSARLKHQLATLTNRPI